MYLGLFPAHPYRASCPAIKKYIHISRHNLQSTAGAFFPEFLSKIDCEEFPANQSTIYNFHSAFIIIFAVSRKVLKEDSSSNL